MTKAQKGAALLWLLLGLGLLADGIIQAASWLRDPEFGDAGLDIGFAIEPLAGVLSLLLSYALTRRLVFARSLGATLSVVFTMYVLYILALTPPDFRFRPVLFVQISVIALCAGTLVMLFWRRRG